MPRAILILSAVASSVVIAACSSGGAEPEPAPAFPTAVATLTSVPEVTTEEARTGPLPWELPRTDDVPGVLLADWGPREGWDGGRPGATSAALLPLHSETAADLPGYQPFDFGHYFTTAASPDGELLAAVIGPTQEASSTGLALIDLTSWAALSIPDDVPTGVELIGWSADGAWVYVKQEDYIGGLVSVYRVSRDGAATEQVVNSLATRTWGPVVISPDASSLYLPGYDGEQCCGIEVKGDPYVVAVEAATGKEVARVSLPELGMGQHFETVEGGVGEYNVSVHPALALSADGGRLFVAHADEDRLTVIDTATMTVADVIDLEPPRSALSRFGSWVARQVVGVAEAKGGLSFYRQATLSADGSHLLLTGEAYEPCEEIEYFECTIEPMGLQVVSLETMELVAQIEDVDSVTVSPDGRYLLGTGDFWDWRTPNGNAEITGYGLKIIDAQSFEVVAPVLPNENILTTRTSPDGRHAYLVTEGEGYVENEFTHVRRCETDCWRLTVVDLSTLSVIGERSLDSGYLQLEGITP